MLNGRKFFYNVGTPLSDLIDGYYSMFPPFTYNFKINEIVNYVSTNSLVCLFIYVYHNCLREI